MSNLILIAGLPGAGKSTLARKFAWDHTTLLEADLYPGIYTFRKGEAPIFHGAERDDNGVPLIKRAHQWCIDQARLALQGGGGAVVSNTFSQKWETRAYYILAREYGAQVYLIDLFDQGLSDESLAQRNTHGVPLSAIAAMRARWEHGQQKVWLSHELG